MIRAILFDADGVVIKARSRFFSERFAEKQGIAVSEVVPFFTHDMPLAFVNKINIKESLMSYLPTWQWKGTVEEFLDFWFKDESPRDEEFILYVDSLRASGIKCYLATDRECNGASYLMETVGLKNHFDGGMFSFDFGHVKESSEYFLSVATRLHLAPQEILFIDDDPKNVSAAKEVGIDARLFTGLDTLKREISTLMAL